MLNSNKTALTGGVAVIYAGYRQTHPLCNQIKEQMRAMIISYAIRKDERLPEVREISSRLAVNPNLVAQAYNDLEKEGYVYFIEGAGAFAADKNTVDERRRQELFLELDNVARELSKLSVSAEEMSGRMRRAAEGEQGL